MKQIKMLHTICSFVLDYLDIKQIVQLKYSCHYANNEIDAAKIFMNEVFNSGL